MLTISKLVNDSRGIKYNLNKYFLHTKSEKQNIATFRMDNIKVPSDASSFSYVSIGKKTDKSFSKEILGFFDNNGRIIHQILRTNGKISKTRLYEYSKKNVRVINIFSGEGVKLSSELQKIKTKLIDGVERPVQLLTKKTNYLKDKDNNNVLEIIFTHFPHLEDTKTKIKKIASAKIVERRGQKVLTDFQKSGFGGEFNLSKRDKFLLCRFLGLNTDEGLSALTKRFLKVKNIFKLNLNIIPSSNVIDSNIDGDFSVVRREIKFNPLLKTKSPLNIVNAAAHEVEHAYQYSQIGRLGKGRSSYETDALRQMGELKTKDVMEAIKYSDARYNYPIVVLGKDLSKNEKYLTNYLEVRAREAAKKAEEEYMYSNIQNYLFFDLAYS